MFLSLWNYIRGYVIIEVTGFSVERFVNLATHKGVYIWDVSYKGTGVQMKVSIKGFKMLRSCARKTKCRVKIIKKEGYPFKVFRYRKRKIFVAGLIFFIGVIYLLSSFIWLIEIKGNERITHESISNYFTNQGFKVGAFKYKINKKKLEQDFINKFGDISWVNISIKGTKATINLTEILPTLEIIDRSTPCNVIAEKDGLIANIVTSAGTPLVKEKDVVQKGDLLVSGMVVSKEGDAELLKAYVHASAEIRGKTYYEINFDVPFKYEEKIETGNNKSFYRIKLFEQVVDLNLLKSSIYFRNYDKITSRNQIKVSDDYPLPLIIIKDEYREFDLEERTRTESQLKELAEKMVNGRIIRELPFQSDIMDKEIEYTQTPEGLKVKAIISAIERIDKQVAISNPQEGENLLDGTKDDTMGASNP